MTAFNLDTFGEDLWNQSVDGVHAEAADHIFNRLDSDFDSLFEIQNGGLNTHDLKRLQYKEPRKSKAGGLQ